MTSLQERPLVGALLSEGGASQEGGLLGMLGLGGAEGGGLLQQMAQNVQDTATSGTASEQEGGILAGGGLLGNGEGSQLLPGAGLLERMRSAFGGSGQGFLTQLMGGGQQGGDASSGMLGSMMQNAGVAAGAENEAPEDSLAAHYYGKAGN